MCRAGAGYGHLTSVLVDRQRVTERVALAAALGALDEEVGG